MFEQKLKEKIKEKIKNSKTIGDILLMSNWEIVEALISTSANENVNEGNVKGKNNELCEDELPSEDEYGEDDLLQMQMLSMLPKEPQSEVKESKSKVEESKSKVADYGKDKGKRIIIELGKQILDFVRQYVSDSFLLRKNNNLNYYEPNYEDVCSYPIRYFTCVSDIMQPQEEGASSVDKKTNNIFSPTEKNTLVFQKKLLDVLLNLIEIAQEEPNNKDCNGVSLSEIVQQFNDAMALFPSDLRVLKTLVLLLDKVRLFQLEPGIERELQKKNEEFKKVLSTLSSDTGCIDENTQSSVVSVLSKLREEPLLIKWNKYFSQGKYKNIITEYNSDSRSNTISQKIKEYTRTQELQDLYGFNFYASCLILVMLAGLADGVATQKKTTAMQQQFDKNERYIKILILRDVCIFNDQVLYDSIGFLAKSAFSLNNGNLCGAFQNLVGYLAVMLSSKKITNEDFLWSVFTDLLDIFINEANFLGSDTLLEPHLLALYDGVRELCGVPIKNKTIQLFDNKIKEDNKIFLIFQNAINKEENKQEENKQILKLIEPINKIDERVIKNSSKENMLLLVEKFLHYVRDTNKANVKSDVKNKSQSALSTPTFIYEILKIVATAYMNEMDISALSQDDSKNISKDVKGKIIFSIKTKMQQLINLYDNRLPLSFEETQIFFVSLSCLSLLQRSNYDELGKKLFKVFNTVQQCKIILNVFLPAWVYNIAEFYPEINSESDVCKIKRGEDVSDISLTAKKIFSLLNYQYMQSYVNSCGGKDNELQQNKIQPNNPQITTITTITPITKNPEPKTITPKKTLENSEKIDLFCYENIYSSYQFFSQEKQENELTTSEANTQKTMKHFENIVDANFENCFPPLSLCGLYASDNHFLQKPLNVVNKKRKLDDETFQDVEEVNLKKKKMKAKEEEDDEERKRRKIAKEKEKASQQNQIIDIDEILTQGRSSGNTLNSLTFSQNQNNINFFQNNQNKDNDVFFDINGKQVNLNEFFSAEKTSLFFVDTNNNIKPEKNDKQDNLKDSTNKH